MGASELVTLTAVVSVVLGAISRARSCHLWSWKAYALTMLLIAAYLGLVLAVGIGRHVKLGSPALSVHAVAGKALNDHMA